MTGLKADEEMAVYEQAARSVLGATTNADVIERERREAGASMYYI